MNRYDRWGFVVLLLSLSAVLAGACQRLDPDLTGGRRLSSHLGVGGADGEDPGTGGSDGVEADCPSLRTQAFDILQTNCAICHQAPGTRALYDASFKFILDLAVLTSSNSPMSLPGMPVKYVVGGSPADSFIYRRIVNGSMPPSTRDQRPTSADIDVLNQWITSCIDDPTSPQGWSGSGSTPDAGVAGPTLQSCGTNGPAVCPDNGCCVFNKCRPNGTTCGSVPSSIVGQVPLQGLGGTCTNGSCQKVDGGGPSCGSVGEPCCDNGSCTASQASCAAPPMSPMCYACGAAGQPCCTRNECLDDHVCLGARVGVTGTCALCGKLGQPCCGSGSVFLQTCDPALTCVNDTANSTLCTDHPDAGTDR
jgi:hypothetical protein